MKRDWSRLEEKYWKGESSLEEEAQLRKAALSGEAGISEALRQVMAGIGEQGQPVLDSDFEDAFWRKAESKSGSKTSLRRMWAWRYAAAAAVIAFIGLIAIQLWQKPEAEEIAAHPTHGVDTFEDPEEAFRQAVEALHFASEKLSRGAEPVREIRRFHQSKVTISGANSAKASTP